MKQCQMLLFASLIIGSLSATAQSKIDKEKFFVDEKIVEGTLITDLGQVLGGGAKMEYQDATLICKMPDSAAFTEGIRIRARGEFRRKTCYMPSLRLNFHNTTSPKLSSLDALKLVCACKTNNTYEQYLLKEYLIYKIYNLLTPMSFRVRLVKMNYEDSKKKKKDISEYAFFIEDIKDLAKRNGCKEWKGHIITEQTERRQMTMVSVFQYMIGNTDWAVPVSHNTRFIRPKKDSTAAPFVVPYDFDFAGLVNADYAIPAPQLTEITSVRQRLYRGFPRSMGELQEVFKVFNDQKEKIYALVNSFELLTASNRKDIIGYLDEFYKTINSPNEVQNVFIDHARTE